MGFIHKFGASHQIVSIQGDFMSSEHAGPSKKLEDDTVPKCDLSQKWIFSWFLVCRFKRERVGVLKEIEPV